MLSHELIRRFPQQPDRPILYVVYEPIMVPGAESLIELIHGKEYKDKYVTVIPKDTPVDRDVNWSVYLDYDVNRYKHSWNE